MRRNYDKILVTIYSPRVEVSLSEDNVLKSKSMYCSMLNVSTCVTAMFPCLLAIESDLRLNILRGLIVKMLELLRDTRGRAWAVSYFPGRAGPARDEQQHGCWYLNTSWHGPSVVSPINILALIRFNIIVEKYLSIHILLLSVFQPCRVMKHRRVTES